MKKVKPDEYFTNGMIEDYEYGKKLIKIFGLSEKKLMPRPQNAIEYFNVITTYKVIMGARLHACISAVALGIPVVGISWDDKFRFFSQEIGIDYNFVDVEDMDGNKVAEMIKNSVGMKYNNNRVDVLKTDMLKSIRDFLRDCDR